MSTESQTLPARLTNLSAADVYSNQAALDDVLTEIEQAARSITPPDVSTKAGREAISSLAYKIARSKTFIDEKLGKPLVADWKAKAASVDKLRKVARDRLDALKTEVRQPLTEFEQAEADRQARIRDLLEGWHRKQESAHRIDPAEVTSDEISDEISRIDALPIAPELEERQSEGQQIKDATLYRLHLMLESAKQHEQERREIAQEKAEREAAEREAHERQITEQATAKAKQEAEQAAQATIERERQRAEQETRAAEEQANAQLEEQRQAHQAQLEALQRQQHDAETTRCEAERETKEAERKRHLLSGSWPKVEFVDPDEYERRKIADIQQSLQAANAARAASRAQPKGQAGREHQAAIHREVLADLCDLGIAEATARHLITAIARGQIAHLTITY